MEVLLIVAYIVIGVFVWIATILWSIYEEMQTGKSFEQAWEATDFGEPGPAFGILWPMVLIFFVLAGIFFGLKKLLFRFARWMFSQQSCRTLRTEVEENIHAVNLAQELRHPLL